METILITGGHAGLGFEAASKLASSAELHLLLAGLNMDKVEVAAQRLRERYGARVTALALDLASLDSVRRTAAGVRRMIAEGTLQLLEALICNAGAQFLEEMFPTVRTATKRRLQPTI